MQNNKETKKNVWSTIFIVCISWLIGLTIAKLANIYIVDTSENIKILSRISEFVENVEVLFYFFCSLMLCVNSALLIWCIDVNIKPLKAFVLSALLIPIFFCVQQSDFKMIFSTIAFVGLIAFKTENAKLSIRSVVVILISMAYQTIGRYIQGYVVDLKYLSSTVYGYIILNIDYWIFLVLFGMKERGTRLNVAWWDSFLRFFRKSFGVQEERRKVREPN